MEESSILDARCIGIVLAGGRSRRMGRDKALLEYGASTLLQHQVDTLAQVCGRVVVSGDYPNYDCVRDVRPDRGPLGGIDAAARQFGSSALLFLPVDMPAMTPDALRKLLAHGSSCHFDGQPLPCSFPDALAVVEAIGKMWDSSTAMNSVLDLHRALASRPIDVIGLTELENINTPAHWNRFNSPIES